MGQYMIDFVALLGDHNRVQNYFESLKTLEFVLRSGAACRSMRDSIVHSLCVVS